MTPGQNDAAVIDIRKVRWLLRQLLPLDNRSAAGRAPVRLRSRVKYGMTLTANTLHGASVPERCPTPPL